MRLGEIIRNNAVTILFVAISIACILLSGMRLNALSYELMARFSRNAFIILALIIPIVAGMGINFAITIGAMAAQIAILLTLNWRIGGIGGFLLACGITIPLAALFGLLVGILLNKMKGQEMIGSMILGYFANGLYQLLFLYIFGSLIPISTDLTIPGASGIRNTLDLGVSYGFKGALDNLWRLKFVPAVFWCCGIALAVFLIVDAVRRRKFVMPILVAACAAILIGLLQVEAIAAVLMPLFQSPVFYGIIFGVTVVAYVLIRLLKKSRVRLLLIIAAMAVLLALLQIKEVSQIFTATQVPMATLAVVALLCIFNVVIMRTRLGQRFRAVGQNRAVSNAAGINVDRTRITAITISTILAGLGQVIFMQNFGAMQTYSAHEQVGLYAGAAILVGGASIVRATNGQAILGCILFHILFIVAPAAGNTVFGNSAIGEYFRVFVSYGVIALALVLHGLRSRREPEAKLRAQSDKA